MSAIHQRAHEQARQFVQRHNDKFETDIDYWVQIIAIQLLNFHQEETREQTENIEREISKYL
jgi:hypothetical protein